MRNLAPIRRSRANTWAHFHTRLDVRGLNAELDLDDSPRKRLTSIVELLASGRMSLQDIQLQRVRSLPRLVRSPKRQQFWTMMCGSAEGMVNIVGLVLKGKPSTSIGVDFPPWSGSAALPSDW
jgi:hypothetical protein